MKQVTREEWLIAAVESLNKLVFNEDLDLLNHQFQIACGRCRGNRATETIQPSDAEDITLDDFFPTTISVDFKIKDTYTLVLNLAHECIKAFLGATKGKKFARLCEKYYFEAPYKEPHATAWLEDTLNEVIADVENNYGPWPGKAVVFPKKESKTGKSNKVTFFCPNCGWETYTTKANMKNKTGAPVCLCGTKMGVAQDDEDNKKEDDENQN